MSETIIPIKNYKDLLTTQSPYNFRLLVIWICLVRSLIEQYLSYRQLKCLREKHIPKEVEQLGIEQEQYMDN